MGPHGTVAIQPETRRSGQTEVKAIPIMPAKLSVNHFWQDNEPHLKQRNTLLLSTITIQLSHTEWQQLYFHHRTRNKVAWRIISQVCKPYDYVKCSIPGVSKRSQNHLLTRDGSMSDASEQQTVNETGRVHVFTWIYDLTNNHWSSLIKHAQSMTQSFCRSSGGGRAELHNETRQM